MKLKPKVIVGDLLDMFKEIWKERISEDGKHYSQVNPEREIFFDPQCFAHVCGKQAYPSLKLEKENIVLMTPAEHHVFDFRTDMARKAPEFDWVFELREKLSIEDNLK